jgi:hypothetical protein
MDKRTRLIVPIVLSITALAFVQNAYADTYIFDFAAGFDGWQQQWHESNTPGGSDGVVTHFPFLGYLDSASLRFDMGNGLGDDGTLWIEKQFAVPASTPLAVDLGFQLYNPVQSNLNTFEVKAVIDTENPDVQDDFVLIGQTNSAMGWVPFEYHQAVNSPTGQVWVGLGIRVSWEGPREYWIDHVSVSIPAVPEPSLAGMLSIGLITVAFVALRFRTRYKVFAPEGRVSRIDENTESK